MMASVDELESRYIDISSAISALESAEDYAKAADVDIDLSEALDELKGALRDTDCKLTKAYEAENRAALRAFEREVLGK